MEQVTDAHNHDDVVVARMIITRYLRADGGPDYLGIDTGGMSTIDAAGMLAFSQHMILATDQDDSDPDDDTVVWPD